MPYEFSPISLGVNIDHVATIRQARLTRYPDPVHLAMLAERAGADAITLHLREDRRHIQERDVAILRETIATRMNLEMAVNEEIIAIAEEYRPEDCCLVPERREELTTEGGLDVAGNFEAVRNAVQRLTDADIRVSLFVDPDPSQIVAASRTGAPCIELHTGHYANAADVHTLSKELERIVAATERGREEGMQVNAGHGLNYQNVQDIAAIPGIFELNIGHAIIAEALFCGLEEATRKMKQLMNEARYAS